MIGIEVFAVTLGRGECATDSICKTIPVAKAELAAKKVVVVVVKTVC
jgi:hypothetical protein